MNKALETQLVKACINSRTNKTTTMNGGIYTSDLTKYTDPERFQAELDKLHNRQPSPLVHSSELPEINSYKTVTTPMGSLIVTRDADGVAHIFRNSCRHRGAKLVEGSGCNKRIVCPYHAWSYATDGKLNNVPAQEKCFPGLDKESNGLISIPSCEKFGFVWVCPSASSHQTAEAALDEHLGEISHDLAWAKVEDLKLFKQHKKTWHANWKIFAEGGLETYHFAATHQKTISPYFQNNIAVINQLGKHFRVVMPTKAINKPDLLDQSYLSLRKYSHTLLYFMPTSALLIQEDHIEWIRFHPIDQHNTEVIVSTLIPNNVDLEDSAQEEHWRKNHDITNTTLDEDWTLGVGIHETIKNKAVPHLTYGNNEWALKSLNDEIERIIKS